MTRFFYGIVALFLLVGCDSSGTNESGPVGTWVAPFDVSVDTTVIVSRSTYEIDGTVSGEYRITVRRDEGDLTATATYEYTSDYSYSRDGETASVTVSGSPSETGPATYNENGGVEYEEPSLSLSATPEEWITGRPIPLGGPAVRLSPTNESDECSVEPCPEFALRAALSGAETTGTFTRE